MTDTEKTEKETFESFWNKDFEEFSKRCADDDMVINIFWIELRKLKFLHDQSISKKDYQIEELKETIEVLEEDMNLDYEDRVKKQLSEKDHEIAELQNEIQKLKQQLESVNHLIPIKDKIKRVD